MDDRNEEWGDIKQLKARVRDLEAALRQIRDVGQTHRGPYVEGSWFAAVADAALISDKGVKQNG